MDNTSPSLRNRFAGVKLELQLEGNLPRKPVTRSSSYHMHKSCSFTAPSKAPELLTAKRADFRTASGTSKRAQPSTKSSYYVSTSSGREIKNYKDQDLPQFSYMKDTSSSRKKQAHAALADKPYPQTRSSSHAEITIRKNYAQLSGKKRVISKHCQPVDDARNYVLSMNPSVSEGDMADSKLFSPLNNKLAINLKEDVYTRLYNGASKSRERLTESRGDGLANETYDLRHKLDTPRGTNLDLSPKLTDGRTPRSLDPKLQKFTVANKIENLDQFCGLMYRTDPLLFEDPHSLDLSLIPNEILLPQAFLETQQGREMTIYERGEIKRASAIYYVPQLYCAAKRKVEINVTNFKNNYGFDDPRGNYIISMNDHIDYRYEIVKTLGSGSFGSVVLCVDHKYATEAKTRKVAVKIIKNKLDWSLQAVSEIKILKILMKALSGPFEDNILNYCDHFHFRGHMCIVSEALSINLYQFSKINSHRGVSLSVTRFFLRKILDGLEFIHKMNVVHCDIKPENIMILCPHDYEPHQRIDGRNLRVKIIDFGSSCFINDATYSYIQSRFYRAPEVMFGTEYGFEIDLWSLGCLAAELFTGAPLLPGKSEVEQLALFLELFGAPSSRYILREREMLLRSTQKKTFRALSYQSTSESIPFIPKHNDERKLKRTPLFSIFGIDGKVNLQALNSQLQVASPDPDAFLHPAGMPVRRSVKTNSRSLDVALRLPTSNENRQEQINFQKLLSSIFQWDPKERASASQLLNSPFMGSSPISP